MSLTGANSVIMISIPGLFPTPQQLQGFAADDVFDVDQVKRAETLMGVDGKLSGGFVYEEVKQTFALQADSPSVFIFETWDAAMLASGDVFSATATVILSGIRTVFNCGPGFMISGSPMPSVKKLYQPRKWTVAWERTGPSPQ
jgi:hypothetical protein